MQQCVHSCIGCVLMVLLGVFNLFQSNAAMRAFMHWCVSGCPLGVFLGCRFGVILGFVFGVILGMVLCIFWIYFSYILKVF